MNRIRREVSDGLLRVAWSLCLRFVLLAPLCLAGWLLLLPSYAYLTGWTAALCLRLFWGEPISGVEASAAGILNTDTALRYVLGGRSMTMAGVGHLMANIAPFVALVLASPASWRRRAGAVAVGVPTLFAFHVITIVLRFEAGRSTVPTVVGFVSVTLPFLLWIVLVAWDSLIAAAPKGTGEGCLAQTRSDTERR